MKRREFLAASCWAGATGMATVVQGESVSVEMKQILELREYQLASADHQRRFDEFLGQAAIPALKRLGIGPVGVFKMAADENPNLYMLLPHPSLSSVVTAHARLLADAAFQEAGQPVLNCSKEDPAYTRFTSSLLLSFDRCPKVEVPSQKETRLFQLRIYESRNSEMAKRKVEMFNRGGEIDLFRQLGLNPVFFGEALIGDKLPNLTYMVGFDDAAAQEAAWAAFKNHPDWKKLSSDPYYKDTVSHITNLVLRPTAGSEV